MRWKLSSDRHTRRIGVVGIDDQPVVRGLLQLRAVVAGQIALQSVADLLRSHVEVQAYCNGGQHVVHVVSTYKMRVHLIDIGLTVDMPAEGKEGLTHADLTLHLRVAVSAIADDALQLTLLRHIDEMLVAGIEEDKTVVGFEEVIELTLGLHYALKRTEALQVRAADVGDQSACRLHIVNQSFDVAGMRSTHLHHSDLVIGGEPQQCLGHASSLL